MKRNKRREIHLLTGFDKVQPSVSTGGCSHPFHLFSEDATYVE